MPFQMKFLEIRIEQLRNLGVWKIQEALLEIKSIFYFFNSLRKLMFFDNWCIYNITLHMMERKGLSTYILLFLKNKTNHIHFCN